MFLVLWQRAEGKARRNYEAGYADLREKLLKWFNGRRTIGAKELLTKLEQADSPYATDDNAYADQGVDSHGTEQDQTSINAAASETASLQKAAQPESVVELTPEEIEAEKARVTLRNLNTMLYMASFLLVAAAATFIAAAMPEIVRLVGLIIAVAAFYVVGLGLYKFIPRFRPAALAFVGTALAILPFVGVALHLLGGVDASVAWLSVSLIGLCAYAYASIVLNSQVVSYLTMGFVLSVALSAVTVVTLPVIWYFVVMIVVALVASSVSYLKPDLLPAMFKQPVEATGQIVTPVAMVASLFAARSMTIEMYELLFAVGTAHYFVVWLQRRKYIYEVTVRVLAHITVLIVAWDITSMPQIDKTAYGVWWLVLLLLQAWFSLARIQRGAAREKLNAERLLVIAAHIGVIAGLGFWTNSLLQATLVTLSLVAIGALGFATAMILRQANWGYVSLVASIIVPFTLGRWAIEPAWPTVVLMETFVVLSGVSMLAYHQQRTRRSRAVRVFLIVAAVAYALTVGYCGVIDASVAMHGWSMVFVGALFVALSYVAKRTTVELIGAAAASYGVGVLASTFADGLSWKLYAGFVLAAISLALGAVAHHMIDKYDTRRNMLIVATLVTYGLFALLSVNLITIVEQVTFVLTAAVLLGVVGLRWVNQAGPLSLKRIFTISYIVFLGIAWIEALNLSIEWRVLYFLLATAVLWLASRIEGRNVLMIPGNTALAIAIAQFWQWRALDYDWVVLCTGLLAGAIFYFMYSLYATFKDIARQWIMLVSAWVALIMAAYFGYMPEHAHQLFAVMALLCSAGVIVVHRLSGHNSVQERSKLDVFLMSMATIYVCLGLGYMLSSAYMAAWAFAVAGGAGIWLSYRMKNTKFEVAGAGFAVAAICLWVSQGAWGEWKTTVAITIATILLAVGIAVHARRNEYDRQNGLMLVTLIVIAGLVLNYGRVESGIAYTSFTALLIAAIACLLWRWLGQNKMVSSNTSQLLTAGYTGYVILVFCLSLCMSNVWQSLAAAAALVVLWTASHIDRSRTFYVISQLFVYVLCIKLWDVLHLLENWSLYGAAWAAALLYLATYGAYTKINDVWRTNASLVIVLLVLVGAPFIGGIMTYADHPHLVASYGSLMAAGAIVVLHGYMRKLANVTEVGAYVATYGAQQAVSVIIPDINIVFYAHWWAATIAIAASVRINHKTARYAIAAGLVTASVGMYALRSGGIYQLLFLIEHVGLLAAGSLFRRQWAVWWGLTASIMAILYFIKDYTYLWLGLLGLVLIALVVWRLNKISKS